MAISTKAPAKMALIVRILTEMFPNRAAPDACHLIGCGQQQVLAIS